MELFVDNFAGGGGASIGCDGIGESKFAGILQSGSDIKRRNQNE